MIDDVQIHERPEEMEAVSRAEANGMWTQLDAARIAQQGAAEDIARIKRDVATLVADGRWLRAGVFLLLLWNVGEAVMASTPAQALYAMVVP